MALIVIDGLDGSGKTTQFDLLEGRLRERGIAPRKISFPDYDHPSSALIKMYLAGDFGEKPSDVNAYAASSFYAVDRYASFKKFWERDYREGVPIIAARYTTSNAIHQMVKLNREDWEGYLRWLYDYEFGKLGLPCPDAVLFLDMPPQVSQKLLSRRYQGDEEKKDIHERNVPYLLQCRQAALFASECLGWKVIPCCSQDGEVYSVEKISDAVLETVLEILGTSHTK